MLAIENVITRLIQKMSTGILRVDYREYMTD